MRATLDAVASGNVRPVYGFVKARRANTCSIDEAWVHSIGCRSEELVVHGAREHNLKDVTVRLPRNRLVCITGLSGRASRRSLSTRSTPKGSGATSSRSPRTRGSSCR